MRLHIAAFLAALPPSIGLANDMPPPANAMKLSEIVATLEQRMGDQLAYIDQADWDDDGYWEVEYKTTDGAAVEVKLDPISGEQRGQ